MEEVSVDEKEKLDVIFEIPNQESVLIPKITRVTAVGNSPQNGSNRFFFSIFLEGLSVPASSKFYEKNDDARREREKLMTKIRNYYEVVINE